jgi:hypothetical protein
MNISALRRLLAVTLSVLAITALTGPASPARADVICVTVESYTILGTYNTPYVRPCVPAP